MPKSTPNVVDCRKSDLTFERTVAGESRWLKWRGSKGHWGPKDQVRGSGWWPHRPGSFQMIVIWNSSQVLSAPMFQTLCWLLFTHQCMESTSQSHEKGKLESSLSYMWNKWAWESWWGAQGQTAPTWPELSLRFLPVRAHSLNLHPSVGNGQEIKPQGASGACVEAWGSKQQRRAGL